MAVEINARNIQYLGKHFKDDDDIFDSTTANESR